MYDIQVTLECCPVQRCAACWARGINGCPMCKQGGGDLCIAFHGCKAQRRRSPHGKGFTGRYMLWTRICVRAVCEQQFHNVSTLILHGTSQRIVWPHMNNSPIVEQ